MLLSRPRRGSGFPAAFTIAAFAIALVIPLLPGPALAAPAAPPYTTSRYMQTVSTSRHYDLGCALGTRTKNLSGTQQDVVILHYFRPVRLSDGSYGASLLSGSDARTSSIAAAAREFAHGYYVCTGTDTTSKLTLALGTSNDGSQVTFAHGKAWAQMVQSVNGWLSTYGYSSQAWAVGASDIELGFNGPGPSRAWVDGFSAVCCPLFYDYGDAAGCRYDGRAAGSECGTGSYPSWTAEDVWYIAWGAAPSRPLPQIYRTDGAMAKQWYGLSLYARNQHSTAMWVMGALTQSNACATSGCSSSTANTPSQGWTQLWNALNCKYFITTSCPTGQSLTYSTDMSWTD